MNQTNAQFDLEAFSGGLNTPGPILAISFNEVDVDINMPQFLRKILESKNFRATFMSRLRYFGMSIWPIFKGNQIIRINLGLSNFQLLFLSTSSISASYPTCQVSTIQLGCSSLTLITSSQKGGGGIRWFVILHSLLHSSKIRVLWLWEQPCCLLHMHMIGLWWSIFFPWWMTTCWSWSVTSCCPSNEDRIHPPLGMIWQDLVQIIFLHSRLQSLLYEAGVAVLGWFLFRKLSWFHRSGCHDFKEAHVFRDSKTWQEEMEIIDRYVRSPVVWGCPK